MDAQGDVYFADSTRVRMVNTQGIITTVAGGGTQAPTSGTAATSALLGVVNGVAIDGSGNLYFTENAVVLKMAPGGKLTVYAKLRHPLGIVLDGQGNLYVADSNPALTPDSLVYEVTPNGQVTTVAGGGSTTPANGANPLNVDLQNASGLAIDSAGNLSVFAPATAYLLKITGVGTAQASMTVITSTSQAAFASNVPASTAYVTSERTYDNSGIALDSAGNLYVADSRDDYLCKIDTNGIPHGDRGKRQLWIWRGWRSRAGRC